MVPKHHIKQTICPNRPTYREGRKWKAVKVYTVNQESKYLLVQGIPALGTCQQLIKLFTSCGAIEEYRVLDDFPAEEFTEVYLIKYRVIYSARKAKRKLDDYSFFGGILHVSFAPEYETVDETREKLVDRRKSIASRCRKLFLDQETTNLQERNSTASREDAIQDLVPGDAEDKRQDSNQLSVDEPRITKEELHAGRDHSADVPHKDNATSPQVINNDSTSQQEFQYWLPPPPQNLPWFYQRPPPPLPSRWQYARVPSAHATLPGDFENYGNKQIGNTSTIQKNELGEQSENFLMKDQSLTSKRHFSHKNYIERTEDSTIKTISPSGPSLEKVSSHPMPTDVDSSCHKSSISEVHSETSAHKSPLKPNERLVGGLLVKKITKPGPPPRFIPRQINKQVSCSGHVSKTSEQKDRHGELKQNAFILGAVHGPGKQIDTKEGMNELKAEKSWKKSTLDIRKRVKQFTEEMTSVKKRQKQETK